MNPDNVSKRAERMRWFDEGKAQGATHMIVLCDAFSYEDYPVYVKPGEDAREIATKRDGQNMARLMEVFDLRTERDPQFDAPGFVFNYNDGKGNREESILSRLGQRYTEVVCAVADATKARGKT